MLKPTAATARSPQHAQKKKKQPSPRLTEAPVQSQAAKRVLSGEDDSATPRPQVALSEVDEQSEPQPRGFEIREGLG